MTDGRDALMIGRTTDGRLVQRPLSPHLQIYRRQITSVLSILHRLTGIALGAGTLLMTWWLIAAATGPAAWSTVRGFTLSWVGLLLLFGWTLALVFHTLNGIRHVAWDSGLGFDLRTTHASGWTVVVLTLLVTGLLWAVAIVLW